MAESAEATHDIPLESSMPGGAVPLASILLTEELHRRPSRPREFEKENSALAALVSALAESPRTILQTLAEKVLEVLHAGSAGLSLLTKDETRFYWAAIAGAWGPHVGGGTPRNFGPCGDVLDHNVPMLFSHWEWRYPYLSLAIPLADEGLLVPFYVNGKAVGTIWAIAHNKHLRFDAEDLRLLESMGRFASAAYQAVQSIEKLQLEIAAREKAETEVRELARGLEARIRRLVEANVVGIVMWNLEGAITAANDAFLRMVQYDREDLASGRVRWTELTPAEWRDRDERAVADLKATGIFQPFEKEYLGKDGSRVPVLLGGALFEGSGNEGVAFVLDLSEQKRAESALRRSEARKASILDSALDCIIMIDHEGSITEFNPAAERTFGYRRDEVVGERLADVIVPPSLRDEHQLGLATYLATGQARVLGRRLETTAVRADASEFPVELAITRIPSDGPPSFTGYLRDITERKQSEEELRRSAALLAEAQRLSLTGSFSWRVATNDVTYSEQTYRTYDFDPSVPLTLELIATRIHPEDMPLFYEMIDRARGSGGNLDFEYRLQMPDRSVKYLHLVAHATRDKDGQLEYIGAIQDVTQRRLTEQALGKVHSELAHVARVTTLGALTASIAHEVNQPLSGIITNASTCLRMLGADPPNVDGARETARRTIRDGHRASDVIARLRALFAKNAAMTESVDLNEATREVIALTLSELQRIRVILRAELAEDLPPVTGDRVQLQQVILNLLRNASDAMSDVDDRPRHLVIRTERDEGDCVRLAVQDAGVGFEPEGVSKLFEAFYTTKSDGMGIGLSVSYSIIESHHGRLWAALNDGPGATFSFSIPCAPERMHATSLAMTDS